MKKQNIIIFDFNRTLYDPEKGEVLPDVKEVLKQTKKFFKLALVSAAVASRKELLDELGLATYFEKVVISRSKNAADFKKIIKELNADVQNSFVVGDRVKGEILIGNSVGLQTVWIQAGKFADEFPGNKDEEPTFTVKRLREILKIVKAL